jgi:hypothetical protein
MRRRRMSRSNTVKRSAIINQCFRCLEIHAKGRNTIILPADVLKESGALDSLFALLREHDPKRYDITVGLVAPPTLGVSVADGIAAKDVPR